MKWTNFWKDTCYQPNTKQIENMNIPIFIKVIKVEVKRLPEKKFPRSDGFSGEFHQIIFLNYYLKKLLLKKIIITESLENYFTKKEGYFPHYFMRSVFSI